MEEQKVENSESQEIVADEYPLQKVPQEKVKHI